MCENATKSKRFGIEQIRLSSVDNANNNTSPPFRIQGKVPYSVQLALGDKATAPSAHRRAFAISTEMLNSPAPVKINARLSLFFYGTYGHTARAFDLDITNPTTTLQVNLNVFRGGNRPNTAFALALPLALTPSTIPSTPRPLNLSASPSPSPHLPRPRPCPWPAPRYYDGAFM